MLKITIINIAILAILVVGGVSGDQNTLDETQFAIKAGDNHEFKVDSGGFDEKYFLAYDENRNSIYVEEGDTFSVKLINTSISSNGWIFIEYSTGDNTFEGSIRAKLGPGVVNQYFVISDWEYWQSYLDDFQTNTLAPDYDTVEINTVETKADTFFTEFKAHGVDQSDDTRENYVHFLYEYDKSTGVANQIYYEYYWIISNQHIEVSKFNLLIVDKNSDGGGFLPYPFSITMSAILVLTSIISYRKKKIQLV